MDDIEESWESSFEDPYFSDLDGYGSDYAGRAYATGYESESSSEEGSLDYSMEDDQMEEGSKEEDDEEENYLHLEAFRLSMGRWGHVNHHQGSRDDDSLWHSSSHSDDEVRPIEVQAISRISSHRSTDRRRTFSRTMNLIRAELDGGSDEEDEDFDVWSPYNRKPEDHNEDIALDDYMQFINNNNSESNANDLSSVSRNNLPARENNPAGRNRNQVRDDHNEDGRGNANNHGVGTNENAGAARIAGNRAANNNNEGVGVNAVARAVRNVNEDDREMDQLDRWINQLAGDGDDDDDDPFMDNALPINFAPWHLFDPEDYVEDYRKLSHRVVRFFLDTRVQENWATVPAIMNAERDELAAWVWEYTDANQRRFYPGGPLSYSFRTDRVGKIILTVRRDTSGIIHPNQGPKTRGPKQEGDHNSHARGYRSMQNYISNLKNAERRRERRRLLLEEELASNSLTVKTAAEHRQDAWEWYNNPNAFRQAYVNRHGWNPHYVEDPELVGRSPRELLMAEVITVYFGMYGWDDRENEEPFEWLMKTSCNPYLRWQETPNSKPRHFQVRERNLCGFRQITLFRATLQNRFEGYWNERVHHELTEDLKPGRQRNNKVVGAGNPHRNESGRHTTFLTWAKTSDVFRHPQVVIVDE